MHAQPIPSATENNAAAARRRAHSGARRRHGDDDPGARPRRRGLSRRPLRCLEPRGARQQRSAQSQPAGRGARHSSRLFPRRRRHRLDQHLLLDPHRASRLRHGGDRLRTEPGRRAARARGGAASRRTRTAARASSPAPSARPTAPPRSRPTFSIRAFAPSPSTSCASLTPSRCAG